MKFYRTFGALLFLVIPISMAPFAQAQTPSGWTGSPNLPLFLQTLEQTTPVPPDSVPPLGSFWSAQFPPGTPGVLPPLPGNLNHLPAWDLGNGNWLLADQNFDYSALTQQPAGLRGLNMSLEFESGADYASDGYLFDTNALWLELTNISGGWSYLNLRNGTNMVYAIWSTTNLATTTCHITPAAGTMWLCTRGLYRVQA